MKLTSVLSLGLLCLALLAPGHARADSGKTAYPAPVRALKANGIDIRGTMPAPDGFKGFIGEYRGQPMPVYLLPDGKHTVVGNLFDADGKDLTRDAFADRASAGIDKNAWSKLAKADWISEGAKHAKRTVYVFTDTECPYCHRLWNAIRPQVKNGEVQVRYLLVAVIKPQSLPRAASVLDAADPIKAFARNERDFRDSPIKLAATIPPATRAKIAANVELMNTFGIDGTPGIVYKDEQGRIHSLSGMPPESGIKAIFGP
ncbi:MULTISPECIES: thiol:disulfide interchange protein DsbG [Oleiagrimonas]|uniref:Thiol:disulfide interchange protein n=1 Tax=Oleiagrimonas citrea TaxID=1665687 RepID=A0A846ZJC6_9GAMM|nr:MULTISPECIES: thiol:disulfide interchange protein DsbG [Oleiagrimonas]NKZ37912.1 thiol:disulfide interchange protein DsbG [Oleiagrimonas citrea]RAP57411.1 thiol:disulfide interchange protein DsbG [Oleiagrimonas sp. MCCC 1A03011]